MLVKSDLQGMFDQVCEDLFDLDFSNSILMASQ
jgi:hypothetical protein